MVLIQEKNQKLSILAVMMAGMAVSITSSQGKNP